MTSTVTALMLVAALSGNPTPRVSEPAPAPIRQSIQRVVADGAAAMRKPAPVLPRAARLAPPHRSAARIIGGVIVGGAAGMFAGAFTGNALEHKFWNCHCDDTGLVGTLVGAAAGMSVGAVVGGLIAR